MEGPSHILVVDDNEMVRVEIRRQLETAGYQVTEAENGREALAALRRGPLPHVILLDIGMPGMNGVEFRVQQLRIPDLACVPVIIHSFVPSSEAMVDMMQASGYLTKPADTQVLLDTVREVLAGR